MEEEKLKVVEVVFWWLVKGCVVFRRDVGMKIIFYKFVMKLDIFVEVLYWFDVYFFVCGCYFE